MQNLWQDWLKIWSHYILLRWALLHALAWPVGFFLVTFSLQLAGFLGFIFAGAIIGGSVGAVQAYLLYEKTTDRQRWVLYSAAGGFIGSFPAYILALLGLFSWWIAALLVGLAFGGALGGMQAYALFRSNDEIYLRWLFVTILVAILGTWLTVFSSLLGLPLILSPSGALFGLALGYLRQREGA